MGIKILLLVCNNLTLRENPMWENSAISCCLLIRPFNVFYRSLLYNINCEQLPNFGVYESRLKLNVSIYMSCLSTTILPVLTTHQVKQTMS